MTTMIGNEAAQLNTDASAGQETDSAAEQFNYRQFSKAMNRARYLDEIKARVK